MPFEDNDMIFDLSKEDATEFDLDEEELQYNRKINELRNLQETKITQLETMREMQ